MAIARLFMRGKRERIKDIKNLNLEGQPIENKIKVLQDTFNTLKARHENSNKGKKHNIVIESLIKYIGYNLSKIGSSTDIFNNYKKDIEENYKDIAIFLIIFFYSSLSYDKESIVIPYTDNVGRYRIQYNIKSIFIIDYMLNNYLTILLARLDNTRVKVKKDIRDNYNEMKKSNTNTFLFLEEILTIISINQLYFFNDVEKNKFKELYNG